MTLGVLASLPSLLLCPSGLTPGQAANLHFPGTFSLHSETPVCREPGMGEWLRPQPQVLACAYTHSDLAWPRRASRALRARAENRPPPHASWVLEDLVGSPGRA